MARIGIGLPVYNGEKYLAAAIDSLIAQTYRDFEIVICDNQSTDATESICREYADQDSRIVYHKNEENIGASANFNRVFELSSGEFFKWAAADDLCEPELLERCIDAMDRNPEVVLACPVTKVIDDHGEQVEIHHYKMHSNSPDPVARFTGRMLPNRCFEVFGLIRREPLARTPVMGLYDHGDGVLLARLALLGPFAYIPEPLFLARTHAEQSMNLVGKHEDYAVWYNPKLQGKRVFPFWRRQFEFFKSVRMVPMGFSKRMKCYRMVARATYARRDKLIGELKYQLRSLFGRRGVDPLELRDDRNS